MTSLRTTHKEAAEKAIKQFDFAKVRRIMKAVDWKWGSDQGDKVPTIEQMKRLVRHLVMRIYEDPEYGATEDNTTVSTGGFRVSRWNDVLNVEFIVEEVFIDNVCALPLNVIPVKNREDDLIFD